MKNGCIDLTGMRFGRLVVLYKVENYVSPKGYTQTRWLCKCDCGTEKIVHSGSLKRGLTISCGCYNKEKNKLIDHSDRNKNSYNLEGKFGIGYTNIGEEFYFDIEDYDRIKDYCWSISSSGYMNAYNPQTSKTIRLHQIVMKSSSNDIIDHINHNKLDNRKSNLRVCTTQQNNINSPINSKNKSGVIGVIQDKYGKWIAYITLNGQRHHLGMFEDKIEAIKSRLIVEKDYFGEFSPQKELWKEYGINI